MRCAASQRGNKSARQTPPPLGDVQRENVHGGKIRATAAKHHLCRSGAVPHTAAEFYEFSAGGRKYVKANENFAPAPGNPPPCPQRLRHVATRPRMIRSPAASVHLLGPTSDGWGLHKLARSAWARKEATTRTLRAPPNFHHHQRAHQQPHNRSDCHVLNETCRTTAPSKRRRRERTSSPQTPLPHGAALLHEPLSRRRKTCGRSETT